MKEFILMRHCKSDWSSPGMSDHERPLNKRGRRSATALGKWLKENHRLPDALLCSSAARTLETAQLLDLPEGVEITVTRDLYLAEPDEMLTRLRAATGERVLMVAHNPGSAALASELLADWPDHPDFPRYPTGATLVVRFDIDTWQDLQTNSGTTIAFVVPREL